MRLIVGERLRAHRWPWLPLARWRYRDPDGPQPVRNETGLVIEGFPRSGNTFLVEAFRMAEPELVLAHHLHAPAQLLEARRRGIPALVLVRDPDDAVLSLVIRDPRVTLADGFRRYVRFHERIAACADAFVGVPFAVATADPGSVADALNERFGRAFHGLPTERVPECLARVEASERRKCARRGRIEERIAVPSPARAALRDALRERLPGVGRLRAEARVAFARLSG